MLYGDYVKNVFDEYQRKKAEPETSGLLTQPTTANLRDACIELCARRFSIRDQGILKTFFGNFNADVDSCVQAIRDHNVNRFRPLVKFMRTGKTDPNVRHINLLAWLIDYQDRPFRGSYVTPVTKGNEVEAEEDDEEDDISRNSGDSGDNVTDIPPPQAKGQDVAEKTKDPVSVENDKTNKKWWEKIYSRKTVVTILILLAANVGAYTWWTSVQPPYPTGNEKCMYWADDHYQPVSCTQKVKNSLVIALDSQKLNGFKRITTPDTITLNSIGNVWYTKVNGNIEYYTSEGFHPIDIRLRLKPITQFMINKYIHPPNGLK
ncbi:MAG: hypothetical protein WCF67_13785 [Chitinophagaceae bacterium]